MYNTGILGRLRPAGDAIHDYIPATPETIARERDRRHLRSHGVALPEVALAYPPTNPAAVSAVVAERGGRQVRETAERPATLMAGGLWRDLEAAGLLADSTWFIAHSL